MANEILLGSITLDDTLYINTLRNAEQKAVASGKNISRSLDPVPGVMQRMERSTFRATTALNAMGNAATLVGGKVGEAAGTFTLGASTASHLARSLGASATAAFGFGSAFGGALIAFQLFSDSLDSETERLQSNLDKLQEFADHRRKIFDQLAEDKIKVDLALGKITPAEAVERRALLVPGTTPREAKRLGSSSADVERAEKDRELRTRLDDLSKQLAVKAGDVPDEFAFLESERERNLRRELANQTRSEELRKERAAARGRLINEREEAFERLQIRAGLKKPSDFIDDDRLKRIAQLNERLDEAERFDPFTPDQSTDFTTTRQFRARDPFQASTIFGDSAAVGRAEPLKQTNKLLEEIRDEIKRELAGSLRLN